jgi:hypothetical protein
MSWRDHIKVHPAADLFPLMSKDELRELGEDIKQRGLQSPIAMYKDKLLDGRNRLDSMELVGVKFGFMAERGRETKNKFFYLEACDGSNVLDGDAAIITHFDGDPYDFVVSLNLRRRHLNVEQRRELLITAIARQPELSNRKIAKKIGVDHKTIGSARARGEQLGRIPQLEKTVGADGKQRKAKKKQHSTDIDPYAVGDACIVAALEAEGADHAAARAEARCAAQWRAFTADEEDEEPTPAEKLEHSRAGLVIHANQAADLAEMFSASMKASPSAITDEAIAGVSRAAAAWQEIGDKLGVTKNDDSVEQCLSLIAAMTKEQRAQFFAKYTELSIPDRPMRREIAG